MALEFAAAVQEYFLILGLNFRLPQSASYMSGRRFASFYPQGFNIYSPNEGTRLIRFVLSDAQNLLDSPPSAWPSSSATPPPTDPSGPPGTRASASFSGCSSTSAAR